METVTFDIEGLLDLHGIRRRTRASVEVTYIGQADEPAPHIVAHFNVKLTDCAIKRPTCT